MATPLDTLKTDLSQGYTTAESLKNLYLAGCLVKVGFG